MKMYDVGEKGENRCYPTESPKEPYYPSFRIKDMHSLKDISIDTKIELKVIGILKEIEADDKGISYRIEIHKCGLESANKKENTRKQAASEIVNP